MSRNEIVIRLDAVVSKPRVLSVERYRDTYRGEDEKVVRELRISDRCSRNTLPLPVDECLVRRTT